MTSGGLARATEHTDVALVQAIAVGDREAFATLFSATRRASRPTTAAP
jgi:hypothetical protein